MLGRGLTWLNCEYTDSRVFCETLLITVKNILALCRLALTCSWQVRNLRPSAWWRGWQLQRRASCSCCSLSRLDVRMTTWWNEVRLTEPNTHCVESKRDKKDLGRQGNCRLTAERQSRGSRWCMVVERPETCRENIQSFRKRGWWKHRLT